MPFPFLDYYSTQRRPVVCHPGPRSSRCDHSKEAFLLSTVHGAKSVPPLFFFIHVHQHLHYFTDADRSPIISGIIWKNPSHPAQNRNNDRKASTTTEFVTNLDSDDHQHQPLGDNNFQRFGWSIGFPFMASLPGLDVDNLISR